MFNRPGDLSTGGLDGNNFISFNLLREKGYSSSRAPTCFGRRGKRRTAARPHFIKRAGASIQETWFLVGGKKRRITRVRSKRGSLRRPWYYRRGEPLLVHKKKKKKEKKKKKGKTKKKKKKDKTRQKDVSSEHALYPTLPPALPDRNPT